MDDYRTHLVEAIHDASRDYDQAILTLAAGTLALSVTFAHDITPTPKGGSQILLLIAWTLLVVALVVIVISFRTSQRDLRDVIAAVDRKDWKVAFDPGRPAAVLTERLNSAGGACLVGGLIFLGLYALANI
jgi:hypothetical protein